MANQRCYSKGRAAAPRKQSDPFTNKGPHDVVILFRWTNPGRDRARALKLLLLHMGGFNCFIALDNMTGGQYQRQVIETAISQCKCVIVVLTDDIFNEGSYVLRELKWVFIHKKKVIPVFENGFDFQNFSNHRNREVRRLMKINAIEWHHNALKSTYEKVREAIQARMRKD